jgi:hypothetical protein
VVEIDDDRQTGHALGVDVVEAEPDRFVSPVPTSRGDGGTFMAM